MIFFHCISAYHLYLSYLQNGGRLSLSVRVVSQHARGPEFESRLRGPGFKFWPNYGILFLGAPFHIKIHGDGFAYGRSLVRIPAERSLVRIPDERPLVRIPAKKSLVRLPAERSLVRIPAERSLVRIMAIPWDFFPRFLPHYI